MNGNTFILPKDKKSLTQIINNHVDREMRIAAPKHLIWELQRLYFRGYRNFKALNWEDGSVVGSYTQKDGTLEFQYQELLKIINENASRISALDWTCSVTRDDNSLEGIRERAIGQIEADAVIRGNVLDSIKAQSSFYYTSLGCVGFLGRLVDDPSSGLTADIEVVHPRELFPFPSQGRDYTKLSGIVRQRVVSLDYLVSKYGKKIEKDFQSMDATSIRFGGPLEMYNGTNTLGNPANPAIGTSQDIHDTRIVKIRELFLTGIQGTLTRYICLSGEIVFEDQDFTGLQVYCPLTMCRMLENGSFHGAGVWDLLFGLTRETEKLLRSLFQNVRDNDRYGILLLPQGQINERQALKDNGMGMRTLFYEPDPTGIQEMRPITIQPQNSGDIPGKTASFAEGLIQQLNPARDIIGEKGRVDSAQGLQILTEEVAKGQTNAALAFSQALSNCYKSLVSNANRQFALSPRPLPVNRLTLDLAGAVIDPEKNTISFTDNPIPDISRLNFSIREVSPRSPSVRKQEALSYVQMQLMDPDAFKILMLEEGIDVAMWMAPDKAAYESCVRNLLLLFGDGEQPGQVVLTLHMANPTLQLRIAQAFSSSPKVGMASPEVQNAIADYIDTLRGFQGTVLPDGYMNPDDQAMQNMQTQASLPPGQPTMTE